MKANTETTKLLLEVVELQRQKTEAAHTLGWLSQASYRQAIATLDRRTAWLEAA